MIGDSTAYGRCTQDGGWAALVPSRHIARDEENNRFFNLAWPRATMLEILDAAEAEVTARRADTVLVTAGMELVLLVLKLGAKFVCGRGICTSPAYGDCSRHGGRSSELLQNGGCQAIGSAGEEAQDQRGHVRVACPDGVHDFRFHCRDASSGLRLLQGANRMSLG